MAGPKSTQTRVVAIGITDEAYTYGISFIEA